MAADRFEARAHMEALVRELRLLNVDENGEQKCNTPAFRAITNARAFMAVQQWSEDELTAINEQEQS